MSYSVKELFYSLQGEGANTGRPAVFCRFSGCNLWSGREADRADAACDFCDTDFVGTDGDGGAKFSTAEDLANAIENLWPNTEADQGHVQGQNTAVQRFVVLTGGEPGLQVDRDLVDALHRHRFEIAIETNGTVDLPDTINWVTVSPKGHAELKVQQGDELKLVYPQKGIDPAVYAELPFDHLYLQPKDGPDSRENTLLALDYCRRHPQWRLSLQTHKMLGIR